MGLSNYPSAADGFLSFLLLNILLSVEMVKNAVRRVIDVCKCHHYMEVATAEEHNYFIDSHDLICPFKEPSVSFVQFCQLCSRKDKSLECCICLNGFDSNDEVGELVVCRHFFHKICLEKWLGHLNNSCPLCRSIL